MGAHRIATTVCPSRILALDDLDPLGLAEWWVMSTTADPLTGARSKPEWPEPGGFLRQPARLVEAAEIMAAEWPRVLKGQEPKKPPPDPDPTKALRVKRPRRR